MKWTNTILSTILFLFVISTSTAQTCEFTLELYDTFGDGWNNASLDIELDGVSTNYTLPGFPTDGTFISFPILVTGTQSINITYNSGFFDNEASYILIGPLGDIIFEDGVDPLIGLAYTGDVSCPSCPPPPLSSVNISDVRAFSADVSWIFSAPDAVYQLEYGAAGFMQGNGQFASTSNDNITLTNLMEDTDYELYLSAICTNGDTATLVQPFTFTTLIAIDVGIIGLIKPLSGCGLGIADTIQVQIHNFGGAPQSLIPFNFSINGQPGGVSHPIDGVFTGVLGIDSTDLMDFDMQYDFSTPGEYEILAWTEMEGDTIFANDTFRFVLINRPVFTEYPLYEDFESEDFSGWGLSMDGQNHTFEFGQPAGSIITNAAGGQNAWVTNLTGVYSNSELSYLESACYDFSSMTDDPIFDFSLFIDAESNFDGMWLESSIDGGQNWEKVGAIGDGLNWYNQTDNIYADWWSTQDVSEWVIARDTLSGTAGSADVRLRYVFVSDGSVQREGFGIDNIYIHDETINDVSLFAGHNDSDDMCGSANDHVIVTFFNHGQNPVSNITVHYQINDEDVVTETAAGVTLQPGEQETYIFFNSFSSIDLGAYTITIWADLDDDNADNDLTVFHASSPITSLPMVENFESGAFPSNWSSTAFNPIQFPFAHNNPSFNMGAELWQFNPTFQVTTPFFGEIEEGHTFSFDYRFSDYFDGSNATNLGPNDSLQIQIAPFCTDEYTTVYTIEASNHVSTTDYTRISLDLSEYVGESLRFRFIASWGEGDYWLDIDNISIVDCPASLDITSNILNESAAEMEDGRIALNPTIEGSYTYNWDSGQTTSEINGLSAGTYTVTVTNVYGCTEIIEFVVDIGVATNEVELIKEVLLAPNPTNGLTTLTVQFAQSTDAQIEILNMLGQKIFSTSENNVTSGEYLLDLSNQSDGIYFVSIRTGKAIKTLKLIKS